MIKTIINWYAFKALRLDPKQKTTLIKTYCHTVSMYMTILCFESMNNCIIIHVQKTSLHAMLYNTNIHVLVKYDVNPKYTMNVTCITVNYHKKFRRLSHGYCY